MAGLADRQPAADPGVAARIDLAAAFRLAARLGLNEGVCNHFSLAVPGRHDRFLLNPYGLHWSEMRAGDLLEVDAAGKGLAGRGTAEATAFFIHSRIHRGKARAT
jgi:ribulose-5-phosphate 4-epimerase/fuculose-1-phosphate aldolase